jgi:hypothetical protein
LSLAVPCSRQIQLEQRKTQFFPINFLSKCPAQTKK